MLINMFTRYGRRFFLDPNKETQSEGEEGGTDKRKRRRKKKNSAFYSDSDESSGSSESETDSDEDGEDAEPDLDADHAMLLSTLQPLLRSRNAGVVVAVATAFHYLAPASMVPKAGKSLVRVLKNNRETQYLVLCNIATLVQHHRAMFDGMAKEFFLKAHDVTCSALLKLEILSQLASEANAQHMMREFNAYIKDSSRDPRLVAATIQAIGRVASWLPALTESCLRGLMTLIANSKNTALVAECVVVVRTLVQQNPEARVRIIRQLGRSLDKITSPAARASVVWMLGAYHHLVPKVTPDALRQLAKSFKEEDPQVKVQVLNLACKLFLSEPSTTEALFRYVLEMARYDMDFDIRDRARMFREMLLGTNASAVKDSAGTLLLSARAAPQMLAPSVDAAAFSLNSLSHVVCHAVTGYEPIPDFPAEVPSSKIREPIHTETRSPDARGDGKKTRKEEKRAAREMKGFYSDDESDSSDSSSSGSSSGSSSDSDSSSGSASDSDSPSGSDSDSSAERAKMARRKTKERQRKHAGTKKKRQADSDSDSDSSSESDASSEASPSTDSSDSGRDRRKSKNTPKTDVPNGSSSKGKGVKSKGKATGGDSLIDLGGGESSGSLLDQLSGGTPVSSSTPLALEVTSAPLSGGGPATPQGKVSSGVAASELTVKELLHFTHGGGLKADYCFTREQSLYSDDTNTVKITLLNTTSLPINNIRVGERRLEPGMTIEEFVPIAALAPGASTSVKMYVGFGGKLRPAKFDLATEKGNYAVSLVPPAGELLAPVAMDASEFLRIAATLGGMHEKKEVGLEFKIDAETARNRVLRLCNMYALPASGEEETTGMIRLAGKTLGNESNHVLLTVDIDEGSLKGNSESTVLCRTILKEVKEALLK